MINGLHQSKNIDVSIVIRTMMSLYIEIDNALQVRVGIIRKFGLLNSNKTNVRQQIVSSVYKPCDKKCIIVGGRHFEKCVEVDNFNIEYIQFKLSNIIN